MAKRSRTDTPKLSPSEAREISNRILGMKLVAWRELEWFQKNLKEMSKADYEKLKTSLLKMVTDPPYGVEYEPQWRAAAGVNKNKNKMGTVENDDRRAGSSRIACHKAGLDFVGCEIDKVYFDAQEKRFSEYKSQQRFEFV